MNAIDKMIKDETLDEFALDSATGNIKNNCPGSYGLTERDRCGDCRDCWKLALTKTDYE